jgi:hypothetical protein
LRRVCLRDARRLGRAVAFVARHAHWQCFACRVDERLSYQSTVRPPAHSDFETLLQREARRKTGSRCRLAARTSSAAPQGASSSHSFLQRSPYRESCRFQPGAGSRQRAPGKAPLSRGTLVTLSAGASRGRHTAPATGRHRLRSSQAKQVDCLEAPQRFLTAPRSAGTPLHWDGTCPARGDGAPSSVERRHGASAGAILAAAAFQSDDVRSEPSSAPPNAEKGRNTIGAEGFRSRALPGSRQFSSNVPRGRDRGGDSVAARPTACEVVSPIETKMASADAGDARFRMGEALSPRSRVPSIAMFSRRAGSSRGRRDVVHVL